MSPPAWLRIIPEKEGEMEKYKTKATTTTEEEVETRRGWLLFYGGTVIAEVCFCFIFGNHHTTTPTKITPWSFDLKRASDKRHINTWRLYSKDLFAQHGCLCVSHGEPGKASRMASREASQLSLGGPLQPHLVLGHVQHLEPRILFRTLGKRRRKNVVLLHRTGIANNNY